LTNIEKKIQRIIEATIIDLGYLLYDVEYAKEGKDYFLRIYIDNSKGIDLDDCEKVSSSITDLLDKEDPIKEQYFLEVSSPGIERVLRSDKHLQDNIGAEVQIKLFKPIDKKKEYIGELRNFNNNIITIEIEGKMLEIERKDISQIKTVYNWIESNVGI